MKISYIIIAYNTEKYIKECIESILRQKHHEQIIIINDGSSDNTLNVINNFKNKEITVINHEKNRGCCYSRMEGMRLATGDYLTFIDSDDYYIKDLPKLNIFSPDIIDYDMFGSLNSMSKQDKIASKGEKRYYDNEIWNAYRSGLINQILVNKLVSKRLYRKVRDNLQIDDLPNYCDNLCIMSAYAYYAKSYKHVEDTFYYYRQGTGMTTYLKRIDRMRQYCGQKEAVYRLAGLGMNEESLMIEVTKRANEYYKWIKEVADAQKQEIKLAKKEKREPKQLDPRIKVNIGDEVIAKKLLMETYGEEIKKYNIN